MTRTRRPILPVLLLAGAAGVAVRAWHAREIMAAPSVHFVSSDCLYHMRRARFAAANFPRTIVFDPVINAPEGGICIWPPLFDVALALPARLAFGAHASAAQVERSAAWVPELFAFGSIVLTGLLASLRRRRWAFPAALFIAFCPGHILYSQLAHTDQHVAESFWGLLLLWTGVRAFNAGQPRASRAWEAAAGLALFAAISTWQGAIFWCGLLAACALLARGGNSERLVLRRSVLLFFLPALLLLAEVRWHAAGRVLPFTYVSFGNFQPAFVWVCGTALLAASAVSSALRRRAAQALRLFGAAVAAALPLLPRVKPLASSTARGIGHLFTLGTGAPTSDHGLLAYDRKWLSQIFEYQPLLSGGPGLALRLLSFAFFLAPVAALIWYVRWRRRREDGFLLLALWGAFTFVFALSQRRNVYYAAPLAALTALELASAVRLALWRFSRNLRRRQTLLVGAAALILSIPMAWGLADHLRAAPGFGSDIVDTLCRFRQAHPPPFDFYDSRFLKSPDSGSPVPGLRGAGAALGSWSLGHLLTYYAEVPVVADNFGYGFRDSVDFFLAGSETDALAIAGRKNVRYIAAADLAPKMNDYAAISGKPALISAQGEPAGAYFESMQSRLYDFDGKGAEIPGVAVEPPLAHFHLVFESRTGNLRFGRATAQWKIFEVDYRTKPGP